MVTHRDLHATVVGKAEIDGDKALFGAGGKLDRIVHQVDHDLDKGVVIHRQGPDGRRLAARQLQNKAGMLDLGRDLRLQHIV